MSVTVDPTGTYLTLETSDGAHRFHAIWLRDNAHDAATRASGNGQRLITLRDIPPETRIAAAGIASDGALEVRFAPEDKTVTFDPAWLRTHAYDQSAPATAPGWLSKDIEIWDGGLMDALPCGDFAQLQQGGDPLCDWLGKIVRYGFAKVMNCLLYTAPSPRD